jgi:hypothetical protein
LKTGDLICYDGTGVLATITKLELDEPFTHVGMILRLPHRWTQQDELYVVESTRNVDRLPDAFTESADYGVSIFKLEDRLHQFHGPAVWYCSLKQTITDRVRVQSRYGYSVSAVIDRCLLCNSRHF